MEKVKIGVVGCGTIAEVYVDNLVHRVSNVDVVACNDIDQKKAEAFAEKYGIPKACSYAEMLAHLRKCPATVFVVPAIIPLVPGSFLYYAMSNAVHGELELARQYGHQTLVCALAIAAGISLAETLRGLRAKK